MRRLSLSSEREGVVLPWPAKKVSLHSLLTSYSEKSQIYHPSEAKHLDEYEQILSYLSAKGAGHRDYRHYATRGRIKSILDGSAIYLTDGSTWNDTFDRERFNPHFSSYKRFGVCLSCSTEESVAMWMLYGGTDGNGAMINFDKDTLLRAMSADFYEFGRFNDGGKFEPLLTIDRRDIDLTLSEVLYFKSLKSNEEDRVVVMRSMGSDRQVSISRRALDGIDEITKHTSWSYEQEVRLVALVHKDRLGSIESRIKCVRVPLELSDDFIASRVYDSPVSDDLGMYRDSELRRTVEWDLCRGCALKSGT